MKFLKVIAILASFPIALMLAGCYDTDKFIENMKAGDEQSAKIRPIIDDYLKNQEKIFEVIKKYKGAADNAGDNESYFEGNDNNTIGELKPLVTQEQLDEFTNMIKEYRLAKTKEMQGEAGGGRKGHKQNEE